MYVLVLEPYGSVKVRFRLIWVSIDVVKTHINGYELDIDPYEYV